jgi:hypothetical protein
MIGARFLVMACVRIAAEVIFAFLSVELSAQRASQGKVTIQVTEIAGVVTQGARIEIDPSPSKPESVFETDSQGRVVLDLPAGVHVLSITFPLFKRWTRQIDVQSGVSQMVDAKLGSGGTIIDWVTAGPSPSVWPLGTPEPVFLPTRPMQVLDPLPTRKAKRHW